MKIFSNPTSSNPLDRFNEKRVIGEILLQRGSDRIPDPPRNIITQSGSRKVILLWSLPQVSDDIAGWYVYKDTENNRVLTINSPDVRRAEIASNSGSSPESTNFFVSSFSKQFRESNKVQVIASATAEASAPTDPTPPADYTDTEPIASNKGRFGSYEL